MLESLFDFISLSALYTMYAGLFLVLLNLVWIWNIEYQFTASHQIDSEGSLLPISDYYKKTNRTYNYIVIWVMQYIRKKTSSPDEDDRYAFSTCKAY
ncbi:hypothetical protein [Robertmurraya massiliosenegalensis]|uniref:hypothetical protein n=1 Tax=Robertmurraya massiliosenegalensis TaxID=1287657 RepID=UPI000304077C|nr:hypothetical protein [Robertmurraya massiliosenegalensis]